MRELRKRPPQAESFDEPTTPKKKSEKPVTPKKKSEEPVTPKKKVLIDNIQLTPKTPSIGVRITAPNTPSTPADRARNILQAATFSEAASNTFVPGALLCRETEYLRIHGFLREKIKARVSGYMYISGTPGSGKTATVHRVISKLEQEFKGRDKFKFIEINGMCLTEPTKAYVKIWEKIGDRKVSAKVALTKLDSRFSARPSNNQPIILFVDELDCIYNRTASVVQNILRWQTKEVSQLIVLTVANSDDLITTLKDYFEGKIVSNCRHGKVALTGSLAFHAGQPKKIENLHFGNYSPEDLEKIVRNGLQGSFFNIDAVRYLIKISGSQNGGDIRAVLHTCKRVIDIIERTEGEVAEITQEHAIKACQEISADPKLLIIKNCSVYEKFLLRAIRDECTVYNFTEFTLLKIYFQFQAICTMDGEKSLSILDLPTICYNLSVNGLLTLPCLPVNIHTPMRLNVDYELITIGTNENGEY